MKRCLIFIVFLGNLHVAIQGDCQAKHTAIVTLHDIGQNHLTCFQSFFSFHQFKPLLQNFTVYHINFPGQEEDAEELPQVMTNLFSRI